MDTISEQISELSWNRDDYDSKLELLRRSKQRLANAQVIGDLDEVTEAYSGLSSTCYSIAGTASKQIIRCRNTNKHREATQWLLLGMRCVYLMWHASGKTVKLCNGIAMMTADQLDVRQSIMRKFALWFPVKRLDFWFFPEAKRCIDTGLQKNPALHTEALLKIGLMEWHYYAGRTGAMALILQRIVEDLIPGLEEVEGQERQLIRVLRACLKFDNLQDETNYAAVLQKKLNNLLEQVDAADQVLKTES